MDEAATDTPSRRAGSGLGALRYLVSLLFSASILSVAFSTELDAIIAGLAWPIAMVAAVVIGLPLALLMRRMGWRRFHHVAVVGALLGLLYCGPFSSHGLRAMLWSVAAGMGGALAAWGMLKLHILPLRLLPSRAVTPATLVLALVVLLLGLAATTATSRLVFGPPASPGGQKTVAAFEVPLPTDQDRREFLDLLRREAAAEGLHVDAMDETYLERQARDMPAVAETIRAAVWRGEKDNRIEASVMDLSHVGFAWLIFSRGEAPGLASRFRDRAMKKILERWPDTRSLPVLPQGNIPLRTDLEATPGGYRLKPSAAPRYDASAPTR